jgi:hypothetical protein
MSNGTVNSEWRIEDVNRSGRGLIWHVKIRLLELRKTTKNPQSGYKVSKLRFQPLLLNTRQKHYHFGQSASFDTLICCHFSNSRQLETNSALTYCHVSGVCVTKWRVLVRMIGFITSLVTHSLLITLTFAFNTGHTALSLIYTHSSSPLRTH